MIKGEMIVRFLLLGGRAADLVVTLAPRRFTGCPGCHHLAMML